MKTSHMENLGIGIDLKINIIVAIIIVACYGMKNFHTKHNNLSNFADRLQLLRNKRKRNRNQILLCAQ